MAKEAKPKSREEQALQAIIYFSGGFFLATVASGLASVLGGQIENETLGDIGNAGVGVFGVTFVLCTLALAGAMFWPRGKRKQTKVA